MAQTELKRQIGLFSAVMLIAGDMIGTGIFISTGAIAETLPTPGGVLLVWLLIGVALRIVEHADVGLRIRVQPMHLMRVAFDVILSREKRRHQGNSD